MSAGTTERTFTQREVDALLNDRLRKERLHHLRERQSLVVHRDRLEVLVAALRRELQQRPHPAPTPVGGPDGLRSNTEANRRID